MVLKGGRKAWQRALAIVLVICGMIGFLGSQGATAASSTKKTSAKHGHQKKLDDLAETGPVQLLHDSNFTRYVDGGRTGRPYHLVVLFTASDPQYKCGHCGPAAAAMTKVAKAYQQQYDVATADEPIVFAITDFTTAQDAFRTCDLRTIPHAFLVPKGENLPRGPEKSEMQVTDGLTKGDLSFPKKFAEDVYRGTGVRIVVMPDTSGLFVTALLLGAAIGFVAHFFADVPSRVIAVLRCRGIWMTGSMACYMTGVGGMIYCIIRNPQPYRLDQRQNVLMMFSQGGREQFWYEGVIVAVMYLMMSAAILGTYCAAGWKRAPFAAREVMILTCLTVLCYVANAYFTLYTNKTQWYTLSAMLTSQVTDLPTGPLKRSHGLLKRLVRLSHLWLNEYTTLEAFLVKLKALLWDYLVRRAKTFTGL